ncbi:MAG TPA: response regulator [Nitrososphaeraceae archaeon]|nr:response regulator [Nitrososphaeraceae archaeon]
MTANTNNDKPLGKLLVVDDDPDTILALKIGLTDYGFLVDAFTNPEEALQKFKSNPKNYSLVMSDSGMPALSGIQLAKKVKEINPNVKVLLLTGFGLRGMEFSTASASTGVVDGFVQKPIATTKLTDKILSLIGETKGRTSFFG